MNTWLKQMKRSAEMGCDRQHSHNPTQLTVCYLTEQRYTVFTAVAGGMFYHPPLSSTGGQLRATSCAATEHQTTVGLPRDGLYELCGMDAEFQEV